MIRRNPRPKQRHQSHCPIPDLDQLQPPRRHLRCRLQQQQLPPTLKPTSTAESPEEQQPSWTAMISQPTLSPPLLDHHHQRALPSSTSLTVFSLTSSITFKSLKKVRVTLSFLVVNHQSLHTTLSAIFSPWYARDSTVSHPNLVLFGLLSSLHSMPGVAVSPRRWSISRLISSSNG